MNHARRHAKTRKPTNRWSQRRRPVLVRRKDVTPEAWASVPVWRKYPKRLLDEVNKGPCMTLMLKANAWQGTFVGPSAPSLESMHHGYPLTNLQRKRLHNSSSIRWFRQKLRQAKGASLADTLRMGLTQSATE